MQTFKKKLYCTYGKELSLVSASERRTSFRITLYFCIGRGYKSLICLNPETGRVEDRIIIPTASRVGKLGRNYLILGLGRIGSFGYPVSRRIVGILKTGYPLSGRTVIFYREKKIRKNRFLDSLSY